MRADIQKPRGFIWINKCCPAAEPVKIWNNKYKSYDYQYGESKSVFYRNYPFPEDGKGETFIIGTCQCCLQNIKHYTNRYYHEVFEYNRWNSEELSEKSHYCESCAIKIAEEIKDSGWCDFLSVKNKYTTVVDDQHIEVTEYDDGSTSQEMTRRESQFYN